MVKSVKINTINKETMMTRFAAAVMIAFFLLIGLSVQYYTISKCGWSTFFLGKNAAIAAVMGMCDDE